VVDGLYRVELEQLSTTKRKLNRKKWKTYSSFLFYYLQQLNPFLNQELELFEKQNEGMRFG